MNVLFMWIALAMIMTVIEVVTVTFFFIWIAIGAVVAIIAGYLGVIMWLQLVIFVLVSVILIIATRPLAKKLCMTNANIKHTKESLIGKMVVVTKDIDNLKNAGEVKVDGVFWRAKSEEDSKVYPRGTEKLCIKSVEGLKLVVGENELKQ